MRIEKSVEIHRPREEVFDFIRDPNDDPTWCDSVLESKQVAGDGPTVGAEYEQVHKPGPVASRLHVEITAIDAPRSMTVRSTDDLGEFDVTYRLEELPDGGTRLTQTDDIRLRGFGRILTPIMWVGVNMGIRQQFRHLKAMLESRTASDHSSM